MAAVLDLDELATTLLDMVGPAAFAPLSTRVLLRTGVNLRRLRPDQVADAAALAKVVAALADMGYRL